MGRGGGGGGGKVNSAAFLSCFVAVQMALLCLLFFIYPQPKPQGYDPLTGAMEGSDIA